MISAAHQLDLDFSENAPLDLAAIFRDAHRQLKPRSTFPVIDAEFFPFAGLNHTARLAAGNLRVRVSDIFTDAPVEILSNLALILLARLYRKNLDAGLHQTYRGYILRSDIQERARTARSERGRKLRTTATKGRHVDLIASFDRVNQEYFAGAIERPVLSWSHRRSRYILGRYDALHHAIFISRILDSSSAPAFVIDYVMFHELLHAKHRSRVQDNRCIVHTREFRHEEKQFRAYRAAKQWLREKI